MNVKIEDMVAFGPLRYAATSVELSKISADVNIVLGDLPSISYAFVGTQAQLDAIAVSLKGGVLELGRSSSAIRASHSSHTDRLGALPGKLTIEVPKNTPLTISGTTGEIVIGDVGGSLRATIFGGTLTVDHVSWANLHAAGDATEVIIKKIDGHLSVVSQFGAEVTVVNGTIKNLIARCFGSGFVKIEADVVDAKATVALGGDVILSRLTGSLEEHDIGSGSIFVHSRS